MHHEETKVDAGVTVDSNSSNLLAQQAQMEEVLKELEDIKYALDQSSIVAVTDRRGKIIYVNDLFCKISQYDRDELLGQDHQILNSGHHSHEFFKQMWKVIGSGETWRGEIKNKAKDGSHYWVDTTIVSFLNERRKPYQYIAIRNDITPRKKMEEEIRKSEEKYRLITENSSDLISIVDKEGKFLYVSPSHTIVLGHSLDDLETSRLSHWLHEEDVYVLAIELAQLAAKKKMFSQLELRVRNSKGKYIYMDTKINLVLNQTSMKQSWVLVMRDITERKQSEQEIYHLAYHDTLTDLPNRRLFMNELRKEITGSKLSSSKLAVMFIDLDRFKYVNDSWGHDGGDFILTEAAARIKDALRPFDLVARLGGDEFTVMLTNIDGKKDAMFFAESIQKHFQDPIMISGQPYNLSCSIGVTLFPENGNSADELLTRADTALYAVKERGRNGYALFQREMEERSLERILLESEIRKAIQRGQFHLDYQPKMDFAQGKLIGMEALVRWIHPELGKIPPNKFIPLAEETGLIIPLGEWVLRRACEQNKEWQDKGYPPVTISVNISGRQLEHSTLVDDIKEILNETGLDPNWLELEVTESAFANIDHAVAVLQEMRDLGIHISIDDFGTGYSSFSYIKHLPADTLKIDGSFIRDIDQNEESEAIVKAVLTLAKTLDLNVIAEGVEAEEQLKVLNKVGCHLGQGYLFSRPLSSEDFEKYINKVI